MSKSHASKMRGLAAMTGTKKPEKCIYDSKKPVKAGTKTSK